MKIPVFLLFASYGLFLVPAVTLWIAFGGLEDTLYALRLAPATTTKIAQIFSCVFSFLMCSSAILGLSFSGFSLWQGALTTKLLAIPALVAWIIVAGNILVYCLMVAFG